MTITVSAAGDEIALSDFYQWLCEDLEIVRTAELRPRAAKRTGHMGALELVDVVLSNATALGSLALAYVSWRRARPEAPPLTFARNQVSVVVVDGSAAEVQRIVNDLVRGQNEDADGDG